MTNCLLCQGRSTGNGFCAACASNLPYRESFRLQRRIPPLGEIFALMDYRFPLDKLIHQIKFSRDLAVLRSCSLLLAGAVSDCPLSWEVIIPVPLGRRRYYTRGFNQAAVLGSAVGERLKLPVAPGMLSRPRRGDETPQSLLDSAAKRRANVAGAFSAAGRPTGAVLLIDDVLTTGATLRAAALALRANGCSRVDAAVLAVSGTGPRV